MDSFVKNTLCFLPPSFKTENDQTLWIHSHVVWVPDVDAILLMLEELDLGIPPTKTILFEQKY